MRAAAKPAKSSGAMRAAAFARDRTRGLCGRGAGSRKPPRLHPYPNVQDNKGEIDVSGAVFHVSRQHIKGQGEERRKLRE